MTSLRTGSVLRNQTSIPQRPNQAARTQPRRKVDESKAPKGFPGTAADYQAYLARSGRLDEMREDNEVHKTGAQTIAEMKKVCEALEKAHNEGDYETAQKHLGEAYEKTSAYGACLESLLRR